MARDEPGRGSLRGRAMAWARGILAAGCALYAGAVLVALAALRWQGDRWWAATMLMYGPRWVVAAPLAVLLPLAALANRRSLPLLAVAAAVALGPVMDFRVPLVRRGADDGGPGLVVLTCNLAGRPEAARRLRALIEEARPDVVALQEIPGDAAEMLRGLGWHVAGSGSLCVGSRFPIEAAEAIDLGPVGGTGVLLRSEVNTSRGRVAVFDLHLATPGPAVYNVRREGLRKVGELEANIALRWRVQAGAALSVRELAGDVPYLVTGDFNTTADSAIFRGCWPGYTDAFAAAGLGYGHTRITRWFGARIDHVLASPAWRVRRCWIGPDVGSDHRPVLAELGL